MRKINWKKKVSYSCRDVGLCLESSGFALHTTLGRLVAVVTPVSETVLPLHRRNGLQGKRARFESIKMLAQNSLLNGCGGSADRPSLVRKPTITSFLSIIRSKFY